MLIEKYLSRRHDIPFDPDYYRAQEPRFRRFKEAVLRETYLSNTEKLTANPNAQYLLLVSHKCHFDYAILGLYMHYLGLKPPVIIAGENLNLPLLGRYMHKLNVYFIPRTVTKSKIKQLEIISEIYQQGHNIILFIEGGRSYYGSLNLESSKNALLRFIIKSHIKNKKENSFIAAVPISYDRILTDYIFPQLILSKEMKESEGKLTRLRGILKYYCTDLSFYFPSITGLIFPGLDRLFPNKRHYKLRQCYIDFGEPKKFDSFISDWKNLNVKNIKEIQKRIVKFAINDIATLYRISCPALFAYSLGDNEAISHSELEEEIGKNKELLMQTRFNTETIKDKSVEEIIRLT